MDGKIYELELEEKKIIIEVDNDGCDGEDNIVIFIRNSFHREILRIEIPIDISIGEMNEYPHIEET